MFLKRKLIALDAKYNLYKWGEYLGAATLGAILGCMFGFGF